MADGIARFGVLGPLVFERDGEARPVPSGRQRSLLALLLMSGGVPLSRDRLIDELWGEQPPASAVSALHVHLSKLRTLLGGVLALGPAGYALEPGSFEVDVWRFDELVEQARSDRARAAEALREALQLFRGEPLCDVASEGSVAQWRRALEEKRLQAIMLRIDVELAAGAAGDLLPELEPLLAAHPFEERLTGQLMLALYRGGRQGDALDAYQRFRRLLASELGLEPGEQLSRLQQRILERDPALIADGGETAIGPLPGAASAAASPRVTSRLPRSPTRLVGRQHDLTALTALLADPDVQLVTLVGPGGVGKTRLLLELARSQESAYADGAVFVRLEQVTDAALVAAEIATALARRDGADGLNADSLSGYLRERELLLVIDNFEHLLAASVPLAELLSDAPRLRVLVSSRTPLSIRGENVFEVEPLGLPESHEPADAAASPAVEMFLQCALATNRSLAVDPELIEAVARICRALDGLPLAIELAAARTKALSPGRIAEQLTQPLSIGEHALRDLPVRQQTLEATMRWSYDLLTGDVQLALRSAGVFLGGFTAPGLCAVAGPDIAVELGELLAASLVRRSAQPDRYELLELVRAFALEQLRAEGGEEIARRRHRAWFAEMVEPASQAFDGGDSPAEVAGPLLPDHANLRSALEGAIEDGDADVAVKLALGLRPLWLAGMLREESQELVDRLLATFSIPGQAEIALLRAAAFLDYSPDAKTWHRRLARRASELGDQEALATATGNLFGQALNARDRDEMRRLRPDLLALLTPETSARALGWIHYFLALDAYVDGRFETAAEHAALSADKAAEVGHEFMLASAIGTGLLARSARDGAIAHDDLTEALALMRRPGVPPLAAFALWFVARYAAGVEPSTAAQWLAHAERILVSLDSELWPESNLRDETLDVLGLRDLGAALEAIPPLDHAAALTAAAEWLDARDPSESAPRKVVSELSSAPR